MRRIGVVTGSRIEARCLPDDGRFLVRCSGADAARARAHAEALVASGSEGLLSCGLAGGLDPALRPGDLLLPEAIILPALGRGPDGIPLTPTLSPEGRGGTSGDAAPLPRAIRPRHGETLPLEGGGQGGGAATLRPCPTWRQDVAKRLDEAAMSYRSGALVGSDLAITAPAAKRALHAATGAHAVDMESHVVGAVAARHGLPFLVLRAVADPADARLPAAALQALGPDGAAKPLVLLRALLARPGDVVALTRLVRASRSALDPLRRAVRVI